MLREAVNTYIDAFLSMVPDSEDSQGLLVEEAKSADSVWELLRDWLLTNNLGFEVALQVKVWFGLNYKDLGFVMGLSSREVLQLVRTQRSQMLPSYPSVERSHQSEKIEGLSCFMVEQYLSPWLDGELLNDEMLAPLKAHLEKCEPCRNRLQEYRNLQSRILAERKHYNPISEDDWLDIKRNLTRRKRLRIIRWSAGVFSVLLVCSFLAWVMWSKPEKMPNIYEIGE